MPSHQTENRILILHDDPDSYYDAFTKQFPQIPMALCRQTEQVLPTVHSFKPNIIYSWKSEGNFTRRSASSHHVSISKVGSSRRGGV